jgi:PTS system lactose-specific IIA component
MSPEEVQEAAMQIVAYSGDAASSFYMAFRHALDDELDEADECFAAGEKSVNEAHKAQFALLSKEAGGEEIPVTILLAHAQDHLMSSMVVQNLTRELIRSRKDRLADSSEGEQA